MSSNNENYLSAWIMVDSERGTHKTRLLVLILRKNLGRSKWYCFYRYWNRCDLVFKQRRLGICLRRHCRKSRRGYYYSINCIRKVSASSGNTITLSDVSGTWSNGIKVQEVQILTPSQLDCNSKLRMFH